MSDSRLKKQKPYVVRCCKPQHHYHTMDDTQRLDTVRVYAAQCAFTCCVHAVVCAPTGTPTAPFSVTVDPGNVTTPDCDDDRIEVHVVMARQFRHRFEPHLTQFLALHNSRIPRTPSNMLYSVPPPSFTLRGGTALLKDGMLAPPRKMGRGARGRGWQCPC